MKTFKMAFLGGAALSVLSVGAQADDLTDLKAQIEALNARVAADGSCPAGSGWLLAADDLGRRSPGDPGPAADGA